MIDLKNCLILGKITKTHSIKGQVVLRLKQSDFKNIKHMESVFIEIDGLPVPFFVSDFKNRNQNELILSLEDINTEPKAASLIDCQVWLHSDLIAPPDMTSPPAEGILIGYEVVDVNLGSLGILEDILDFDQNPLLRILQDKKEILIPLQPNFIKKVDDTAKKIFVDTPEGLVDLY